MIQIALVAVSIGLIVIGIKGFTKSGLKFSSKTTLTERTAKIVGAICIFSGVAIIPAFILLIMVLSQ